MLGHKRRHQRQGDGQHGPYRRIVRDLHEQGSEHHDAAGDLQDEDGGAVAGVQPGEVEAAGLAPVRHLQEAREEPTLAAVGTAAKQTGADRVDPRRL